MSNKKGFTITELLAVIAVLGIVLVIAIPTYIGINNTVKKKMLEEKIEVIEEAAVLFGESIKETVLTSGNMYKEESPCQSVSISYLVPRYLEKDNEEECLNGNEEEIGCVVDPSDATNYLDNDEVIIYYKNKRIYAVVDINDELVCEGEENSELKINTFYIGNGNPEYTINREVTAYISWDSLDVEYYCVTNTQGSSNCEWKIASGTMVTPSHTLTEGDGEKTIYAYIRDSKGNISEELNDTILLDTSAPTDNSVTINSGNDDTTSTSVTLTLSSTGVSEMCISNTTSCSYWEEYKTSKTWTISSGDGEKTVYVWYKDEHGNITNYVTDTIMLDTSAPTGNSVTINSNSAYTTSTSVTLTLSSNEASEMCISNSTSCSDWETYATSKSWTISSGDGEKTVYVWYKDKLGNTTSSYVTDTISLDTSAPTGNSVKINSNATYTTSTSVTLTLSSSGASEMCISNTSSCNNWETYATSKEHTLTTGDGTKTVYVWFRDASGNKTSSYVSDTIILDTTLPTVTASASSAKIVFSSNEAGTYCVNTSSSRTNMSNCVSSGSVTANTSVTTSALANGTYYVHVKDSAGNIGISSVISLNSVNTICTSGTKFGSCLISSPTKGLNATTAYSGLYRYIGTSVNNYVKLGDVLYRVMGITSSANSTLGLESGQVKLIKSSYLSQTPWHTSYSSNTKWTSSSMYSNLQSSNILGNSSIIPSAWTSKIDSVKWYIGDVSDSYATTGANVRNYEDNTVSSSTAKVGLMYLSDFYYAYKAGGTTNCFANACLNWLTVVGGEWSMTRQGYDADISHYTAWMMDGSGSYGHYDLNGNWYYRPVFYLLPSVTYVSGTGTSSDPFIIS